MYICIYTHKYTYTHTHTHTHIYIYIERERERERERDRQTDRQSERGGGERLVYAAPHIRYFHVIRVFHIYIFFTG